MPDVLERCLCQTKVQSLAVAEQSVGIVGVVSRFAPKVVGFCAGLRNEEGIILGIPARSIEKLHQTDGLAFVFIFFQPVKKNFPVGEGKTLHGVFCRSNMFPWVKLLVP